MQIEHERRQVTGRSDDSWRRGFASLPQELELLAEAVEGQAEEVVERIDRQARESFPELGETKDHRLLDAFDRSNRANLRNTLALVRSGIDVPNEAPADAQRLARMWARVGLPLGSLVRTYALAQATLWDFFVDAIESARLPQAARRTVTRDISRLLFAYADRIGLYAATVYEMERHQAPEGRERRAIALVDRILAGQDSAADELAYDLRTRHLGFVTSGPDAVALAASIAESVERSVLMVHVDQSNVWAWLGGRQQPAVGERRTLDRAADGFDAAVAFGSPGEEGDGFRRTHDQAIKAHRIGAGLGRAVTHYEDVALEALVGERHAATRDFVRDELGSLAAPDRRSAILRETLEAFFGASSNVTAAAAALGVHEQTVSYRLRSIEERIGRPVRSRRAELEIGLRMRRVLVGEA